MDNLTAILDGISVNMQSSIRIKIGGKTVRFDPLGIEGEPRDADVVFITHSHGDHFSPEDIAKVLRDDTVLAAPASMIDRIREIAGTRSVLPVVPDGEYEVCGIPLEAVRAYNPKKLFHPKKNNWVGYVVEMGGARIYVAGDTDATEEAAQVKCDVALVPVGGTYTMTAIEAADLVNRIGPAAAIPTHYGSIVGKADDGKLFAGLLKPEIKAVFKLAH